MTHNTQSQGLIDLLQPSFMKEVLQRSLNEKLNPLFQPSEIISLSGWSVVTPRAALKISKFSTALGQGDYQIAANALLDIQQMIDNGDVK